jgi:hypothetical protein
MDAFSFESQFKAAIRQRYKHEPVEVEKILVVTDLDREGSERVMETCKRFLSGVRALEGAQWSLLFDENLPAVQDLIRMVDETTPDLMVAYRNLGENPRYPKSSLGNYVDTITQATSVPVLVLPVRRGDDDGSRLEARLINTDRVMVITDHLNEDPQLVRYGAEFTEAGGQLFLSHIEDAAVFERYMRIIGKIPEIDDDDARAKISARLLKEARDFVEDAAEDLSKRALDLKVRPVVEMGDTIDAYRRYLHDHEVDLLVVNFKSCDRYAMSDLAYAITIEFVDVPVLLL